MKKQEILNEGKRVIREEAEALLQTSECLDTQFVMAVETLHNLKGKLMVFGVGKSHLIGSKIAATFTSTGTPAMVLHATDALHGDVGIASRGDIALLLSKSGATAEILALLPVLKERDIPVISISCVSDSPLALKSDIHISANMESEVCPHNLAPTTSTTLMLAIGDALAVCLISLRGFSHEDFARAHPSGTLGRKLLMKASDLVKRKAEGVLPDTPMDKVILQISRGRTGAVVVVGKDNRVIGIITDGDLRRAMEKGLEMKNTFALDIMCENPVTENMDISAVHALRRMEEKRISQLILINEQGLLQGLIHLHDIIAEGIRT